jgi:hypothetical protein
MAASTPRTDAIEAKIGSVLIGRQFEEIVGGVNLGTSPNATPFNGPAPLITQGNEIFNINYTPVETGSTIAVESKIRMLISQSDTSVYSLFVDGASDALRIDGHVTRSSTTASIFTLRYEMVSTGALVNFQFRFGTNAINSTMRLNHSNGNNVYGNTISSWALIQEYSNP